METGKLILLLAEDDSDDWDLFQEGLHETAPAITLHWVKHGDDVFNEAKKLLPDILFLDLNMPGCDGIECLKLIKAEPAIQKIPVVMYTTSNAPAQVKECYSLGAARYLLKPVNYTGIFKGIELILNLYKESQLTHPEFDKFVIDTYQIN